MLSAYKKHEDDMRKMEGIPKDLQTYFDLLDNFQADLSAYQPPTEVGRVESINGGPYVYTDKNVTTEDIQRNQERFIKAQKLSFLQKTLESFSPDNYIEDQKKAFIENAVREHNARIAAVKLSQPPTSRARLSAT